MTGFGRGVSQTEYFQLTIEIRSVNHRFLEVSSRFPKEWMEAEVAAKKQIQQKLSRGKLDVSVNVQDSKQSTQQIAINWPLVEAYKQAREELQQQVPLQKEWAMSELLSIDGAVTIEKIEVPQQHIAQAVYEAVEEALHNLITMREREGMALLQNMKQFQRALSVEVQRIREFASEATTKYREKLLLRMNEVTGSTVVEDRVLTEVAIFAEKIDIVEELDRLNSHLIQLDVIFAEDQSIGRKLDFLLQEIHRELNTIGSKNQSAQLSIAVIESKAILEKMREQAQNIE